MSTKVHVVSGEGELANGGRVGWRGVCVQLDLRGENLQYIYSEK